MAARFVADAVTFTTAAGNKTVAITPAVGDLLVVVAAASGLASPPATVTDDRGGTYSAIQGVVKNASADSMQFFIRDQLCQVAVSHTLTAAEPSSTGGGLWVARFAGMQKAGRNAVRQSGASSNGTGGTTPTCSILNPTSAGAGALIGPSIAALFNGGTAGSVGSPPASHQERQDVGYTVPANGLEIATWDTPTGLAAGTALSWSASSASAWGTLWFELDPGEVTHYGSGRYEHPGQPGELQRRRLPFPTQDFTNTNVEGSVTQIAVIGGAVAAGNTPVAVVANTSQGATAGGLTPLPKTVLTAQGALGQGVTPTASTTLTSQGALGQGNTPAPQTILTSQGATGQGVSPVATGLAIFTIQGALAGGAGPGADATPGVGGSTGNGTGPIAVVTFTSQGATAGGVSPVATATAILTIQGATAGGTGPTAVVGVTPGGVTGTGVSSSGSGELAADDFNRTDNADVGSDWTPIPHSPSNTFVIDGNKIRPASDSDDAAEIFSGVVFPDDQYAQGTVKGTFIDRGDGVGIGLCLRGTSAATTYYRIVVQGAGDIGGPDIDISKFVAGVWTDLSLSNAPSNWVDGDVLRAEVQGSGSSVTITVFKNGVQVAQFTDTSGTIASGNPGVAFSSSFPDVFIDDFSAGGLVGGPRAVVGVTPGGALAGGPAPTESTGTADTPAPGGGTAGGTGPIAIVATTSQGATAGGTAPTASTTGTIQGALAQGVGATASSSPTPGGGTADDGTILPTVTVTSQGAPGVGSPPGAVVTVAAGGATAGGTAPGEYYFETPTRGGADAAGRSPSAIVGVTISGGVAGGNAPTETNTETVTPGGATAGGNGATASTESTPGGSTTGEFGPTAVVGVTPGGAIGNGVNGSQNSDDFNRADESLTTPWVQLGSSSNSEADETAEIVGGEVVSSSPGAGDATVYYAGAATSPDQFAEVTLTDVQQSGPAVRISGPPGSVSCYLFVPSFKFLYKVINGGSYDLVAATGGPAWVDGDVCRLEVEGTTLRLFRNGVEEASSPYTDASIATGDVGLRMWDGILDDWSGGDLVGGVKAYVIVSTGGATAGGNAPSAPLQENATPGGAVAGGRSPSADAAADMGGTVTSFGTTTAYVTFGPGGAIGAGRAPTEIGVTPPTPVGPTPGSGSATRVRNLHNRIEEDRRIRDEEEEEALILLGLSLE